MRPFLIQQGFEERDRAAVVALLREYEASLGVSLCFQGFETEVAGLPGAYAPPRGLMLLARDGRDDAADGGLVGMVALRPVREHADACEMKRLYLRPAARGTGLGRRLAMALMDEAARLGYRRICLDTLPDMTEAQSLYRSLGFRKTGTSLNEPEVLLFERELMAP